MVGGRNDQRQHGITVPKCRKCSSDCWTVRRRCERANRPCVPEVNSPAAGCLEQPVLAPPPSSNRGFRRAQAHWYARRSPASGAGRREVARPVGGSDQQRPCASTSVFALRCGKQHVAEEGGSVSSNDPGTRLIVAPGGMTGCRAANGRQVTPYREGSWSTSSFDGRR